MSKLRGLALAIGTVERPAFKGAKFREPLAQLRQPLTFTGNERTTYDSPTRFTPAEYRAALEKLRLALNR